MNSFSSFIPGDLYVYGNVSGDNVVFVRSSDGVWLRVFNSVGNTVIYDVDIEDALNRNKNSLLIRGGGVVPWRT